MLRAVPVFLLLSLITMSCGSDSPERRGDSLEPTFTKEGTLTFIGETDQPIRTIDIEVADTEPERRRGLMQRRQMGYDKGMLFVFDDTSESGMWMKNTPMPLDIIFAGPDSTVINVVKRTKPFSLESIQPTAPKKFVVEVRAGFADRFGIAPGTRLRWSRSDS